MSSSLLVDVALLPNLISHSDSALKFCRGTVVIDTLRFTTTAAQALQAGAKLIRVVQDIESARQLAQQSLQPLLLCGERHCRPIEGFDLGNSPLEYVAEKVAGRELIFSTTNGTRAVESALEFAECFLGGLVNRSAVAAAIGRSVIPNWTIVCAGTDGQVAGEDMLAAGAIIQSLVELSQVTLVNDAAHLAAQLWRTSECQNAQALIELLKSFSGGQNLVHAGFETDVEFASKVDQLSLVPKRAPDGCFRA